MYGFGRWVRGKVSSAKWILTELTGSEDQAIRAERLVGRDMAAAIAGEDAARPFADAVVDACGARLAARVSNRRRQFDFFVLPASQVNAFALPGGFIYITPPLLSLLGWDADCIAFVLGHEMGHVIRGHARDRILSESLVSVLTAALPAAGAARAPLEMLARNFLQSAYSQEQELEADEFGVRLAAAAGFDARAAVKVLGQLGTVAASSSPLAGCFSSHPSHELRIASIQRLLARGRGH